LLKSFARVVKLLSAKSLYIYVADVITCETILRCHRVANNALLQKLQKFFYTYNYGTKNFFSTGGRRRLQSFKTFSYLTCNYCLTSKVGTMR